MSRNPLSSNTSVFTSEALVCKFQTYVKNLKAGGPIGDVAREHSLYLSTHPVVLNQQSPPPDPSINLNHFELALRDFHNIGKQVVTLKAKNGPKRHLTKLKGFTKDQQNEIIIVAIAKSMTTGMDAKTALIQVELD
jgi:hypothetical protein